MSFIERMGFMMRRATKTAKKLPQNSEELKNVTICSTVAANSIPADLIVNWDEIGVRMVPVNGRRQLDAPSSYPSLVD